MMIPIQFQAEPKSIWNLDVPIVRSEGIISCFLTDDILEPSVYNELVYTLLTAKGSDVITLYINTPGGEIDSVVMIRDAILLSKAHVIGKLTGTVASAGTIITLACDEIVVSKNLSFMIHNYSTGLVGKGHEIKQQQAFMEKSMVKAFSDFYLGFLTAAEIESVIEGKDLWMAEDEVQTRWNNFKELR